MRTITLVNGKSYPVYFSFNVLAEMQDRYGDINKIPVNMQNLKEAKWIITTLVNEAIRKKNYDQNLSEPEKEEFEIGMNLPVEPEKLKAIIETTKDAIYDSMGGKKNVQAMAGTTKANLTETETQTQ